MLAEQFVKVRRDILILTTTQEDVNKTSLKRGSKTNSDEVNWNKYHDPGTK